MKSVIIATVFAAASILSVPAIAQTATQPRDTGNMAYPAPLPQGNIGSTSPARTPDTGNMAFPAPVPQSGATATSGSRTPDTGNMAYPAPVPQGQVGTTVVK